MPATSESVEEAAARLETIAPGYLDQVRRRAGLLGVAPNPRARARQAVEVVADASRLDAEAPTRSRRPLIHLVKRVVGALTRFYVVYLTEQVGDLGESNASMGSALCDYIDSLEAEVADLRERVGRLEAGQGPS